MNFRSAFRCTLCCVLFFQCMPAFAQPFISKGVGTANPDSSAVLELSSTYQGFLMPRLDSTQRMAIANPARGLVVYDTDFDQFWYFNGFKWVPLSGMIGPTGPTGPTGPGGIPNAWKLSGNGGTVPGTNFIGTTDSTDWVIKTNGSERARVRSDGRLSVAANRYVPIQLIRLSNENVSGCNFLSVKSINIKLDHFPVSEWVVFIGGFNSGKYRINDNDEYGTKVFVTQGQINGTTGSNFWWVNAARESDSGDDPEWVIDIVAVHRSMASSSGFMAFQAGNNNNAQTRMGLPTGNSCSYTGMPATF